MPMFKTGFYPFKYSKLDRTVFNEHNKRYKISERSRRLGQFYPHMFLESCHCICDEYVC